MKALAIIGIFLATTPSLAQVSGNEAITLDETTMSCVFEADYERILLFAMQEDDAALTRFRNEKLADSDCAYLAAGTEVFIEVLGDITGFSCVRPRGEIECVYVPQLYLRR